MSHEVLLVGDQGLRSDETRFFRVVYASLLIGIHLIRIGLT